MDAIRIIKQDHRKTETLFEQFEALVGLPGVGRTRLIEDICQDLIVHTTVEEQLLYPEARRILDSEIVDHAEQEHDEADNLIRQVQACDPQSTEVERLMMELKQTVLHHVEEEESNFLPRMEEACGTEALESLGSQIEARKEQLETSQRPIEHAASSMVGGNGSADGPLIDLTKEELYAKAQQADIPGRSKMTKSELADALGG